MPKSHRRLIARVVGRLSASFAVILLVGCGQILGYQGETGTASGDGGVPDDAGPADSSVPTKLPDADAPDARNDSEVAADASNLPVDASSDARTGTDGSTDAPTPVRDAGTDVGITTPYVMGAFVPGGSVTAASITVRGQFSWGPAATLTNGTTTVAGAFH